MHLLKKLIRLYGVLTMIKECSPQIPWKHMDIEQMAK